MPALNAVQQNILRDLLGTIHRMVDFMYLDRETVDCSSANAEELYSLPGWIAVMRARSPGQNFLVEIHVEKRRIEVSKPRQSYLRQPLRDHKDTQRIIGI